MNYEPIENVLHVALFVEFIIGVCMWSYWAIKNERSRNYAIGPLLLFTHAILFFILYLSGIVYGELAQIWADLVAIHGVTVIIGGVYVMINYLKREA